MKFWKASYQGQTAVVQAANGFDAQTAAMAVFGVADRLQVFVMEVQKK